MRTSLLVATFLASAGCGSAERPPGPTKPSYKLVRAVQAEMPEGAVVTSGLSVWVKDVEVHFTNGQSIDQPWDWMAWSTHHQGYRPYPPNTGTITPANEISGCDFPRVVEAVRLAHPGFRLAMSRPAPDPTPGEERLKAAVAAKLTWVDVLSVVMPRQGRKGVVVVRDKEERRSFSNDIVAVWFDGNPDGTWFTEGWWSPYLWDSKSLDARRDHWVWWGRHEAPVNGPPSLKMVDRWPPTNAARESAAAYVEHKLADLVREYVRQGRRQPPG